MREVHAVGVEIVRFRRKQTTFIPACEAGTLNARGRSSIFIFAKLFMTRLRNRWLLLLTGTLLVAFSASSEVVHWPLTGLSHAKSEANSITCVNNLKQIEIALRLFANDDGDFPADLQEVTNDLGSSPAVLYCPTKYRVTPITNWAAVDWNAIDHEYIPNLSLDDDPSTVQTRCKIHHSTGHVDGTVHLESGFKSGWPAIIADPMDHNVTPGTTVTFEVRVAASATPPVSYQWQREHIASYTTNITFVHTDEENPEIGYWRTNAVPTFAITSLSGQTNSALIVTPSVGDSNYYSVIVSNPLGSMFSSRARLTVDAATSFQATNEYWSAVHCVNNLKQISIHARLHANRHENIYPTTFAQMTNAYLGWPQTYYCRADTRTIPADWPGVDLSNVSYEILSFPNPPGDEDYSTTYCRCKVHGFTVQLDGLAISTNVYSPVIGRQPQNTATLPGGMFSFSVLAAGTAPLSYQWHKNNSPISGATDSTYSFTNAQMANLTNYHVVITNVVGTVTSATATLTMRSGFTGITKSNASTQLTFSLLPDRMNVLQFSTDLQNWTNLTVYPPTNGTVSLNHTNLVVRRFFRIISP